MTREEVYKLIDGEREYQKFKWNQVFDDSKWSLSDWIVFIERYIQEAKNNTGFEKHEVDSIRKIAALAVACMEQHETLPRKIA